MIKILVATIVSVSACLVAGASQAQTAPAADPHAGHLMPAPPQTTSPADPHAGHSMPMAGQQPAPETDPHAGHDMSAMSGGAVPAMMPISASTGTALQTSVPAAGAMLDASPTAIALTLPHAMIIQSVSLTNAVGQRIPLSATLSETAVQSLTTPVPPLRAGSYTVAWSASGPGHTMTGTFGFMVH